MNKQQQKFFGNSAEDTLVEVSGFLIEAHKRFRKPLSGVVIQMEYDAEHESDAQAYYAFTATMSFDDPQPTGLALLNDMVEKLGFDTKEVIYQIDVGYALERVVDEMRIEIDELVKPYNADILRQLCNTLLKANPRYAEEDWFLYCREVLVELVPGLEDLGDDGNIILEPVAV